MLAETHRFWQACRRRERARCIREAASEGWHRETGEDRHDHRGRHVRSLFRFNLRSHSTLRSYQDPFEEYKSRLAKKLAKKAAGDAVNVAEKAAPTAKDNMNWFGLKVGADTASLGAAEGGSGVGKYLAGAKRPLEAVTPAVTTLSADDSKHKRKKLGFGNFEGW
jgi:hypothetical protein